MKVLNLKDKLEIIEVDDIDTVIDFHITKEMLDYSLKEFYGMINQIINDGINLFSKNCLFNIYVERKITKEEAADLYSTISGIIANYVTTLELKFEEKMLQARDEIINNVVLHRHSLSKILNYKSTIENLQIHLYKRNKLTVTLV